LRPRNNTEDHGNGEGMIGGASGDHGRQEKGKPVVLVLSEAVLVLSAAVIDSGTCARGFLAKTRSSPRGIWRAGLTTIHPKGTKLGSGVCGHGITRKITELGKG
jgi:hypothetical protein